jgi:phytoene dehydrogenase-like protein
MLGHDQWMIDILFEASIADVLDHYVADQRLKDALYGQGVIGAYAGPRDWGTASVKLMHYQGDLEDQGPVWGYVKGGMGMVSRPPRRSKPAALACRVEVSRVAGEGASSRGRRARPRRDLQRRPQARPPPTAPARSARRSRPVADPAVVKFNALPTADLPGPTGGAWPAVDDLGDPGADAARGAYLTCRAGRADVGYEVYFQTTRHHARGRHHEFRTYALHAGRRSGTSSDAIGQQFVDLTPASPRHRRLHRAQRSAGTARHRSPHGLTGGHLQGETMPDQMWEHRLCGRRCPALPCGAATHPAGSVIALNGRNAADAVLIGPSPQLTRRTLAPRHR